MFIHGKKMYCINNKVTYRSIAAAAELSGVDVSYLRKLVRDSKTGVVCVKKTYYFIIINEHTEDIITDDIIDKYLIEFTKSHIV